MNEIMDISRLRIGTDGKGITTLVAFHGCPLHCTYCLNPQCHVADTTRAEYSVDELLSVLAIDDLYFQMTGGGITFGGGEPLLNAAFIREFCDKANPNWNITLETSLHVPWENVVQVADKIDLWIIDIKDMNPTIYKNYTGKENQQVVKNLNALKTQIDKEKIIIRVPKIPNFNTTADIEYSLRRLKDFINIDQFEYVE